MVTKPSLLLDKYQKYNPACFGHIEKIMTAMGTKSYNKVLQKEYPQIEKNSVDFGLFEKLKSGSQWELPVDIGWVDLGTWELLYHGLPKDKNGNVILGKAELIDVKNSLIISRDKKVGGIVGVSDMVVVDTPHGLLVCPLEKAPMVKSLYKQIYQIK
jgi:mannose-1-phosphate guanylyltransferase